MGYARNKNCLPIQLSEILLAYLDGFLLLTSCQAHHYASLCLWLRERNRLFCFVLLMQQSGSFAVKCRKNVWFNQKLNILFHLCLSILLWGISTKGINSSLKFADECYWLVSFYKNMFWINFLSSLFCTSRCIILNPVYLVKISMRNFSNEDSHR